MAHRKITLRGRCSCWIAPHLSRGNEQHLLLNQIKGTEVSAKDLVVAGRRPASMRSPDLLNSCYDRLQIIFSERPCFLRIGLFYNTDFPQDACPHFCFRRQTPARINLIPHCITNCCEVLFRERWRSLSFKSTYRYPDCISKFIDGLCHTCHDTHVHCLCSGQKLVYRQWPRKQIEHSIVTT